jgi:UDP-glucose 4-epimerase
MKIAVVGNTGFIGSHLVKSLDKSGIESIGFNSKNPILSENSDLAAKLIESDCIIWVAGRLNPSIASQDQALVNQECDQWDEIVKKLQSSIFCELRKKIVFLSSGGCVYDYSPDPIKEDFHAHGSNEYGRAKIKMENRLLDSNLNGIVLRVSNVYGQGQQTGRGQGVIAEWASAIKNRKPITVYGNIEASRDFVHVSDLVSAITLSSHSQFQGILNVGSGISTTLQQVLDSFSAAVDMGFIVDIAPSRQIDKKSYVLDISKAKKILGWSPSIGVNQGIQELVLEG